MEGAWDPAMDVGGDDDFVDEANDVLARRYAGDGACEDVIEHQGGDAELGQSAAQGLFDDPIHAAADEHGAAFDIYRPHSERKEHDRDDEPGGGLAYGLLGDATGVEGGRGEIIEHNGGGAPIGNEGEHHRGGDDDANPVRRRSGWERGHVELGAVFFLQPKK